MTLGIGVIGCGVMAKSLATAVRDSAPEAKLVAAYDPFEPTREAFCAEYSVVSLASLEALLAREDIGAVLVASPNFLHAEQTVAAAQAGKHVFCEKPMALSVADCDRMIAACAEHDVRLMVGHALRLQPLMRRLRELVASGELGRPLHAVTQYWFNGFNQRDSGIWHVSRAKCGGLFYQMGIHHIDIMHSVFGPTQRVQYAGGRYGAQIEDFDDVATVLLDSQSGGTGLISVSSISTVSINAMDFLFSDGYVKCDGPWSRMEYGRDPEHSTTVEPDQIEGLAAVPMEVARFVDWVRHGATPVLPAAEGRAAVAVAEAADQARDTGAPVEVAG